ncbi:hypothetical protein NIES3585_23870 [Nodularia sp. NIES-3585]|nr:hypothetical protein NIES3585_23870 [Nodularia sp. NIES-3585]
MHFHEVDHSPLLACGEGVGGGVLVSHLTDNRYMKHSGKLHGSKAQAPIKSQTQIINN